MPVRLISAETIRNDPGIKDPEFACLRRMKDQPERNRTQPKTYTIRDWRKRRMKYLRETGRI